MKIKLLLAGGIVALLGVPALAQTMPAPKTSATQGEKATITYFVEDSVGDVQLGELGVRKAQNPLVRRLAAAMVRDHTRTANRGWTLAQQMGDDEAKFKAGDDNQIDLSHLARYSGAEFDREYVKALVGAHKTDIETAQNALEFTKSPALRSYLRMTIGIDKQHLAMAEAAQKQVGSAE